MADTTAAAAVDTIVAVVIATGSGTSAAAGIVAEAGMNELLVAAQRCAVMSDAHLEEEEHWQ